MCNKIHRVTYPRTYKTCALHSSAWSVHCALCAMEMCNQLVNHSSTNTLPLNHNK